MPRGAAAASKFARSPQRKLTMITSALPLIIAYAASRCSQYGGSCKECVDNGCGWCTLCPYCQGSCMGEGDGVFTCKSSFSTLPRDTCWGPSGSAGGGYACNHTSRMCVPVPPFVAPTYENLAKCVDGISSGGMGPIHQPCRPDDAKPPFYFCNATSGTCEPSGSATDGSTKQACEAQCKPNYLCSGGDCVNFGVTGVIGSPTGCGHQAEGDETHLGECPVAPPGPNCTSFAGACKSCLSHGDRCGWCPTTQTCHDLAAKGAALFECPMAHSNSLEGAIGFTTNQSSCSAN